MNTQCLRRRCRPIQRLHCLHFRHSRMRHGLHILPSPRFLGSRWLIRPLPLLHLLHLQEPEHFHLCSQFWHISHFNLLHLLPLNFCAFTGLRAKQMLNCLLFLMICKWKTVSCSLKLSRSRLDFVWSGHSRFSNSAKIKWVLPAIESSLQYEWSWQTQRACRTNRTLL